MLTRLRRGVSSVAEHRIFATEVPTVFRKLPLQPQIIAIRKVMVSSQLRTGTRFGFGPFHTTSWPEGLPRMIGLMKSRSGRLLTVLGLSGLCVMAVPARRAAADALEGGMAAYQFDGTYKGNSELVAANDQSCRTGQAVALEVHQGRLELPWHGPLVFNARISRDGTFFATAGDAPLRAEKHMTILPTLQGRIGATGLVADYGTRWCHYRLAASQAPVVRHLSLRTEGAGMGR
jgi:hypothetical protein